MTYNVGGHDERPNIEVARAICDCLDRDRPRAGSHRDLIVHVADRPGHDRRYAIDASRLERELGWRSAVPFEFGLAQTVKWYLANMAWCDRIKSDGYRIARIGLGLAG